MSRELVVVADRVREDGFESTLVHYSDFHEIEDEEFHNLRDKYLTTRGKLADYLRVNPDK